MGCHFPEQVGWFCHLAQHARSLLSLSGQETIGTPPGTRRLAFSVHIWARWRQSRGLVALAHSFQRCSGDEPHLNCQVSPHHRGRKCEQHKETAANRQRAWGGRATSLPFRCPRDRHQDQQEWSEDHGFQAESCGSGLRLSTKAPTTPCSLVLQESKQLIKTNYLCW